MFDLNEDDNDLNQVGVNNRLATYSKYNNPRYGSKQRYVVGDAFSLVTLRI